MLRAGYDVIVIDNLSNSHKIVLDRVEQLSGKSIAFYEADVMDRSALENIFKQHQIKTVIHFAGLKAVGESVEKTLYYYKNNLISSLVLLEVMERNAVKNLYSVLPLQYTAYQKKCQLKKAHLDPLQIHVVQQS